MITVSLNTLPQYILIATIFTLIFQTNITGTSTMGSVDGLSLFTNYSCTIHTVIMTFDGPMSDPIIVRTAEASKYTFCLMLTAI